MLPNGGEKVQKMERGGNKRREEKEKREKEDGRKKEEKLDLPAKDVKEKSRKTFSPSLVLKPLLLFLSFRVSSFSSFFLH